MPLIGAEFQEVPHLGSGVTPLFPVAHTNPAANPLINARNRTIVFCYSKVIYPTSDKLIELQHPVIHRNSQLLPVSSRTRLLNFRNDLSVQRILPFLKVKPRNEHFSTWTTLLFCSFTNNVSLDSRKVTVHREQRHQDRLP